MSDTFPLTIKQTDAFDRTLMSILRPFCFHHHLKLFQISLRIFRGDARTQGRTESSFPPNTPIGGIPPYISNPPYERILTHKDMKLNYSNNH